MPRFRPVVNLTSRLAGLARDYLLERLAQSGHGDLEPCHGDLFASLFEKDGLTVTELAQRSHRSKSTMSVMVRRLVQLGYLQKVTDERDVRAVKITLTEKGRELKPVFEAISRDLQATFAKGLTEAELDAFERLLATAVDNFAAAR